MATITSLRPSSASLLLDEKGREMLTFPADLAKALLFIDDRLAALGLRFNIECEHCTVANQRVSYALPAVNDGVCTVNCDHATRRVRLESHA
jgi:hypothetical protein